MNRSFVIAMGAACFAVTACAPVGDPAGHAMGAAPARCFTSGEVANFRVENDSQLYVRARRGGAFRLDAAPNCFIPSTISIAVEPAIGASSRICPGDEARVHVTTGSPIPMTCIARVSGPITDSSISGLPG